MDRRMAIKGIAGAALVPVFVGGPSERTDAKSQSLSQREIPNQFLVALTFPEGNAFVDGEAVNNKRIATGILEAIRDGARMVALPEGWTLEVHDLRGGEFLDTQPFEISHSEKTKP